jgi:hypothetical protein
MAAALGGLLGAAMRPGRGQEDTKTTVRLVANLFVVMTSLVLGLMMNSAKNTLETDNRNVHALGTDLILLDRMMRALGPQAGEARQHLVEYVQASLHEDSILEEDPKAQASLDAVGASLRAMQLSGDQHKCRSGTMRGSSIGKLSSSAGLWWTNPAAPSRHR